ncbi:MAG: hypothetical protein UD936_11200 [Acutalibacteraceae bacterium]|nr:hypothetical protein [Acutalibacteraceae bacterium]
MKKCTKCGFENFDEAYLCRKCGSKLKKLKNKSLDLDIQNSSATNQNYQQQTYQGNTYDPYAQQQYQQQYQANQSYQNTYYDTYQGQQYQQNNYQQYQQAQPQNRGNVASDINNSQYNNGYYDNSYTNNYNDSQADFTGQYNYNNYNNSYDNNSYNNYSNNNYNQSASYNADNNIASNTNSNSFTGNQQYAAHTGNNTSTPDFAGAQPVNQHTATNNSDHTPPMGNSYESNPSSAQFRDTARQHTQLPSDPPPKNVKEFLYNEYQNSVNVAKVQRYKPKIFPLVSIVAFLVIISTTLTILASVWYHGSVNSDTEKSDSSASNSSSIDSFVEEPALSNPVSIEELPELAMNSTTYTLTSESDSSVSVNFQIPEDYYAIPKYLTDSHIAFRKQSNNSQDDNSEELVYSYIAIEDANFEEELKKLKEENNLPETDYKEYVTDTPLGELHCLSVFGAYYGMIPLDDNRFIYISSSTRIYDYRPEAEAVILCVANSLQKAQNCLSDYTVN